MLSKQVRFHVRRIMPIRVNGPEQRVDTPLRLIFTLHQLCENQRPSIETFVAASTTLERELGAMLHNKLLLGHAQAEPPIGGFFRLPVDADAASLGNYLIDKICPPMLKPHGYGVTQLYVSFGAYESAQCLPNEKPVVRYSYLKPTQELTDEV